MERKIIDNDDNNICLAFQQPDFLQKALNHAKCVGDQCLQHGKCETRSRASLWHSNWRSLWLFARLLFRQSWEVFFSRVSIFFKGLCVLMWRKVKDSVSAITALTEKVNGKKMLLDKRLVVAKIFRDDNDPRRFDGLGVH